METNRQHKIAGVLQKDLVDILQKAVRDEGMKGTLISVTKVAVTADLSLARVYLSMFPYDKGKELLEDIVAKQPVIKHELAQRTRNQLRRVPRLDFILDDSLEYIDRLDRSLKRDENPIENPDLLDKRKKA
ncbi:30S ribosome-binding factor RbfA [Ascidiimonas aurantiaca]|uniref:30S ribosome-binding factor RbfA n=1 Tax=Ascidiimonas aurantiaca TaxID=1685432 RepID=UPI0030ED0301